MSRALNRRSLAAGGTVGTGEAHAGRPAASAVEPACVAKDCSAAFLDAALAVPGSGAAPEGGAGWAAARRAGPIRFIGMARALAGQAPAQEAEGLRVPAGVST